jgi:hypothetical protein
MKICSTMATKRADREQRAGRTGSRDRRGLDAAAKKRSGKPAAEGVGGLASGGYAEQTPRSGKAPP